MGKIKRELSSEAVKEYGLSTGASVVGIAASDDFGSAPEGFRPSDCLDDCRSVVVLGAPSPCDVLKNADEYTANRNAMLTNVTVMAKELEKRIKADGYKAKTISAAGGKWLEVSGGKKVQYGFISLKHAAELAGLGQITRNNLLTNPQFGNLLWLSAVLTDAELNPDQKARCDICDNCNKCVEVCHSGALADPSAFERNGCSKFFVIEDKKFKIKCYMCRK